MSLFFLSFFLFSSFLPETTPATHTHTTSPSESLLLNLRRRLGQRRLRIRVLKTTPRLALLELDPSAFPTADAHARPPRAATDGAPGTACRSAVCVVDAASY